MKNIKYIICASLTALSMASCSGYLNKLPENQVDEQKIDYTKTANMYEPVSGVYAKLANRGSHWMVWGETIIRDDDVSTGRTDDQAGLVSIDQTYSYDAGFWGLNESWMAYYDVIKVANAALTSLNGYDQYVTTDADRKNYTEYCGEVKFLRAYCYYRLVQLFGPVTLLKDNTQTDMTRSTVNAVYKYALSDLDDAIAALPRIRPNEQTHIGAVTAFSAEMLEAKIYMNEGNYQKVKDLTGDIISSGKFSLYSDFYQLFKIPGKLCNESLFEFQYTDFGNGSGNIVEPDSWFAFQGPENDGNISGWGFISPTKAFRTWAEERGETVRATTTFLMAGETTPSGDFIRQPNSPTAPDCFNGKAYTPSNQLTAGRTDYGANNNIRVFRYADVLLMNAEATVRLGGNGDSPFNLVRDRAKMPELQNVTLNQILDERRMEFAMEWGERFNDLVRSGNAISVLGSTGYTADKQYYPVPSSQIDISPSLNNTPKD